MEKQYPYINHSILFNECQHPVEDNQCPDRAGHRMPSLQLYITAQFVLAFEPNHESSGGNALSIPRPVPTEMDKVCRDHGGKLFSIRSVLVICSFHNIKYGICGEGASGMIYIVYSNCVIVSVHIFSQQYTNTDCNILKVYDTQWQPVGWIHMSLAI